MKKLLASLFAVIVLFSSCEKPLAERKELDVDVVDGKFTGYVYNYGFCEEPNYWYRFEYYQQRILTFQIPEEKLAKLTPEELSHTCLHYPLRWDLLPGTALVLCLSFMKISGLMFRTGLRDRYNCCIQNSFSQCSWLKNATDLKFVIADYLLNFLLLHNDVEVFQEFRVVGVLNIGEDVPGRESLV